MTTYVHAYDFRRPSRGVAAIIETESYTEVDWRRVRESMREQVDGPAKWIMIDFVSVYPWERGEFEGCIRDERLAGPDGMGYAIYALGPDTTDAQIERAVRETRVNQDVVGRIRVIRPDKFVAGVPTDI